MTEKKTQAAIEQPTAPKKKMGRPSIFTQDIADTICTRLSSGESLRSICRDDSMPSQTQVYVWLNKHKDFTEQYARAREEQADTYADEIIAIADEQPNVIEVKDKEGNVIDHKLDSAFLSWQKNRMDARKWTAMKLKPKKYGDRLTHAGDDEAPMVMENNHNVFGELLKAIKLQRQTGE